MVKQERIPLEQPEDTGEHTAKSLRGYGGVRITAPPRGGVKEPVATPGMPVTEVVIDGERQARILTGAALSGILATVLIHELGHWVAGFALTGMAPDFYVVAVRQKTATFSASEGRLIWLAGPAFHLALLWALVLFAAVAGRYSTRLIAASGAALLFTAILAAGTWALAAVSSPEDWGDDLPRVASFFSSDQRLWMHLLNGAFMAGILAAAGYWLRLMRRRHNTGVFAGPIVIGVIEGSVAVVLGAVLVSFML